MSKERLPQQSKEVLMPATKLPTTVNDIPKHLLKLIFCRLDSHVSFLRAAAVCTRWRHIASTHGMRYYHYCKYDNFRTIMGHYHVVDPSFSLKPRSSQPQLHGRVMFIPTSPSINVRHFTLDFLPSGPWQLVDGYGSLLLLTNQRRRSFFSELVVCEPISRRYVKIKPNEDMKYCHCLGVFLNRRYNANSSSMSSFTLTSMVYQRSMGIADGVSFVTAYVYNHKPPSRRWRQGWSTSPHAISGGIHIRGAESVHYAGRSKGSIFFGIEDDGSVFSGGEGSTGVLSHFYLPENVRGSHHRSTFRFIDDGADNLVRLVSLIGKDLMVFLKKEHNNGGSDWVLVRTLHLPEATLGLSGYKQCFFSQTAKIVTAGKGYVLLTPAEETWLFSVELGTMQVERDHIRNKLADEVHPYEMLLRAYGQRCPRAYPGAREVVRVDAMTCAKCR